jgi:hypothetical protein
MKREPVKKQDVSRVRVVRLLDEWEVGISSPKPVVLEE